MSQIKIAGSKSLMCKITCFSIVLLVSFEILNSKTIRNRLKIKHK